MTQTLKELYQLIGEHPGTTLFLFIAVVVVIERICESIAVMLRAAKGK
jgi:hypothetical protein